MKREPGWWVPTPNQFRAVVYPLLAALAIAAHFRWGPL